MSQFLLKRLYTTQTKSILVPCKRVIDYAIKIRVLPDETGVQTQNVKHSMNPFDEIALEEALRIKEKSNVYKRVVVVSVGGKEEDVLRQALAMGADEAFLVQAERVEETHSPMIVARALKAICERVHATLILMGKQAIDGDSGQTGPILSALLNWPIATFASKIELAEGTVQTTREVEGGLQTVQSALPAIITVDLRLNEPRYATLPNIMKARSKSLTRIPIAELVPERNITVQSVRVEEPKARQAGKMVSSVEELVEHLRKDTIIP